MDALALVYARKIGVIAARGAAGVGEDKDALVVIHEGGGLGKIRRGRPGLDAEAVATTHDAFGPAGHLGDELGTEAVQDLIERALHRRQRRQVLDHAVAALDRFTRDDRVPLGVIGRAGVDVAFLVGEELEQLGREWLR